MTPARLLGAWGVLALLAAATTTLAPAATALTPPREIAARGVPRPLQLAWAGAALLVLSPDSRGESAAEIYRVRLDEDAVDLSRQPRIRVPFAHAGARTFGSLAVDPASGALYLGEENGSRVWRLDGDDRLAPYATGLRRLAGGSTLAIDRRGGLVLLDHADPFLSPQDDARASGLEHFRDEEYRGPIVHRLALDAAVPLPRRVNTIPPFFPRGWGGRGAALPHLVAVAVAGDELRVLSSSGELYRLANDGRPALVAKLPRREYTRANMLAAPDGTVFVSGGFHSGAVFRVAVDGAVSVVAAGLADPAGIALDHRGWLYIAESAQHRIVRVRAP
jgi:sugar lactone lactonase YvrE